MVDSIFEQYLSAVCDFFPIHRLRKRIYKELSAHMQDLLEDFSAQGMDSQTAEEAVLAEMGDPEALRRELIRAYRPTVWRIRLQRLAALVIAFLVWGYVIEPVIDECGTYRYSYTLAEAEAVLSAQCAADGAGELAFVEEIEHNGRLYRYYMPKTQRYPMNRMYRIESVRVFGKELHDRFAGLSYEATNGCYFIDNLDFDAYTNDSKIAELLQWQRPAPTERAYVFIFANPVGVRYFTAQVFPTNEFGSTAYDIPPLDTLPYYAVSAEPGLIVVKYPTGTHLGNMQFLDADKNETPLPSGTMQSSNTIG